ncbi:hypothetical protein PWG14_23320, partial [Chromobacterium amazonense]|uniref:hypothetical protein n=1 Tax=Chromobacterium amazonense TaxID=1382803 RepID=UPI00237D4B39
VKRLFFILCPRQALRTSTLSAGVRDSVHMLTATRINSSGSLAASQTMETTLGVPITAAKYMSRQ